MADASTNGLKRPHPHDHPQNGDSAEKRIKTPNGSPAPQIAGRKDVSTVLAEAKARAEAVKARLQGTKSGSNGTSPAPPSPGFAPPATASGAPMSRLEEMKARVAALTGKNSGLSQQRTASPVAAIAEPSIYEDGLSKARGGLSAALHPSLLETNTTAASKVKSSTQRAQIPGYQPTKPAKGKKQMDLSGPSMEEIRANPYFDSSVAATMRNRNPKQLKFLEKGKYIAQAAALRRQTQLEEMKKRIAMQSRKVGINEDPSEKNFVIEPPPEIEWWDEGLVTDPAKAYASEWKFEIDDSAITRLEVHPIAIAKPSALVEIKPMYLTSKEQAKMRRQRRMADLKEHQMKVRLGMEPPDPPKVKRGNMMRILGEEAVKDPTAVEARVNREIAERAQKHEEMNEGRKLSKEERQEKLDAKKAKDLEKGVVLTVYKIESLANGRHFFKVQKNMEQVGGLGLILSSPKFSLVLCEAGQRGTQLYKKLILHRIDVSRPLSPSAYSLDVNNQRHSLTPFPYPPAQWTENSPSQVREGNKRATAAWLQAEDEAGNIKDLSTNKAQLIFEGEERGTTFRKVAAKTAETDKEAMDILQKTKMASFWTLAKSLE